MTGGKDTKPTEGVGPRCNVSLGDMVHNKSPDLSPLEFVAWVASGSKSKWKIQDSCTPQLGCLIKVNGIDIFSMVGPEVRSSDIDFNHGAEVEVVLTDIFDRSASKTIHV